MSPYVKSLFKHFFMVTIMAVFASVALRLFIQNANISAQKVGLAKAAGG